MTASTHPDALLLKLYDRLVIARAKIHALSAKRKTISDERRTEVAWMKLIDRYDEIETAIAAITPSSPDGWTTLARAARLNTYRSYDEIVATDAAQNIAWAVVVHVSDNLTYL